MDRQLKMVSGDTVVSTDLGDGVALLDLRSNVYFSLDEVGAVVWKALQEPRSTGELIEHVLSIYEVDRDQCATDIEMLLDDLRNAKLIESPAPSV
jgi:hypothetical protein